MVPKYRSTNVCTSSYIRHHMVQCAVIPPVDFSESGATSRVAHSFGSNKLYICLSNKCFKVYSVYSLCTDVRPSQDHQILRVQMVRINLAMKLKKKLNREGELHVPSTFRRIRQWAHTTGSSKYFARTRT